MRTMVVGASKGLGRAFMEGLGGVGDTLVGVSRSRPANLVSATGAEMLWVEADLGQPAQAAPLIEQAVAQDGLDTLIYNLGIWSFSSSDWCIRRVQDRCYDSQRLQPLQKISA